jgi:hypothetical protein
MTVIKRYQFERSDKLIFNEVIILKLFFNIR